MKITMSSCRLCELDQQKLSSCSHKPLLLEQSFVPFVGQVPNGVVFPQMKDIMLAYLFRGEIDLESLVSLVP